MTYTFTNLHTAAVVVCFFRFSCVVLAFFTSQKRVYCVVVEYSFEDPLLDHSSFPQGLNILPNLEKHFTPSTLIGVSVEFLSFFQQKKKREKDT